MSDRSFVLYTGKEGHDLFTKTLDKAVLVSVIDYLYENSGLLEAERDRLVQMVNSDDPGDLLIAKLILNTQHGYTFSTAGT
jgi:hypothetical protein